MSKKEMIHPRQVVRPRSNGRVPVLMCLLVAGLAALVVYRWGLEKWLPVRAKPTYTATAYVLEPGGTAAPSSTAAPGREEPVTQPTATVPRRLPFVTTDADPQRAQETALAMAEAYVGDRRKEWQTRAEKELAEARRAVETARRRHDDCAARLDAMEKQIRETETNDPTGTTDANRRPSMVANPRRLELESQMAELIARRNQLLTDRTSIHPAVAEVSDKIAEIERQMADIPREIPDSRTEAQIDAPRLQAAETLAADNRHKVANLTAEVEQTREVRCQAELAERQAMQQTQSAPRYSVEQAGIVENRPTVDFGWRRLMWTTLAAGLMMAFGAGSLTLGAGIEPPAASAAEVRSMTKKPIIGTIPADDTPAEKAEIGRLWFIRRTAIGIGLFLMLSCPVVAIWGVLGI